MASSNTPNPHSVRTSVFVTILLLFMAPTSASTQPAPLEDSLGTVNTSIPIESWGNLGGVTIDALGYVYVANFHGSVWRVSPTGETSLLSDALYGSSGNAIDSRGRLLQSNFLAHTVQRIDRAGTIETFIAEGLQGPVGIVEWKDGSVFVANCSGNSVSRFWPDGGLETVADGPSFACPNGITAGPDDALYITNFNSHDILRLVPQSGRSTDGTEGSNVGLSVFASVPSGGNAHIMYARGAFYVTQIKTNALVRIAMDGSYTPVVAASTGGFIDGAASAGSLMRPNGITFDPARNRLYINTLSGAWAVPEPATIVLRTVDLASLTSVVDPAAQANDLAAMRAAYDAYRSSPLRTGEDTMAEAITLGYRLLSNSRAGAAIALFEMNAESYPDRVPARFALGEGYRYTGQADKAIEQYRTVLALQPEHPGARTQLEALTGN